MRFRTLASLVLLLSACGPSALAPMTVPLDYRMMADAVEIPVLQECAGVASVEVVDRRTETQLGTRFLQDDRAATYLVTAGGDVAAWVRSGVDVALRRARMNVGAAARPALVITVEQVWTEESVYRRAEYDGRVVLLAELRTPRGGGACWRERVDGFAENYGYAGSAENYQETLNHALDRALIRMLNSSGFRDAVCMPCPARV
ncbi:MAG TPA: hypothetical protein VNA04_08310 [Thermoanaerobaculia bacterium]|nr:hypothetical protein [Thermoanaerobaculia bacterium]